MKILYAIQGTGNGHLSRARAIIPYLCEYGELDLMVSGTEADVALPYPIRYKSKGISFHYNQRSGIHYGRTLYNNSPTRILKEVRDFPIELYDLVVNDFEPISAWAAKKKGIPSVALSHQASFLSAKTPRPPYKDPLGEFILKSYAPAPQAVGFHFEPYESFIHTPVIRDEIRSGHSMDAGHYTVYLPAVEDARLIHLLEQFPEVKWHIFSRYTSTAYRKLNIQVLPIDNELFIQSFTSCTGILTSAGFETPSEALFMGKKLLTCPIRGQYEQACNAEALKKLNVPVIRKLNDKAIPEVERWVHTRWNLQIPFPDETPQIVSSLFKSNVHSGPAGTLDSMVNVN